MGKIHYKNISSDGTENTVYKSAKNRKVNKKVGHKGDYADIDISNQFIKSTKTGSGTSVDPYIHSLDIEDSLVNSVAAQKTLSQEMKDRIVLSENLVDNINKIQQSGQYNAESAKIAIFNVPLVPKLPTGDPSDFMRRQNLDSYPDVVGADERNKPCPAGTCLNPITGKCEPCTGGPGGPDFPDFSSWDPFETEKIFSNQEDFDWNVKCKLHNLRGIDLFNFLGDNFRDASHGGNGPDLTDPMLQLLLQRAQENLRFQISDLPNLQEGVVSVKYNIVTNPGTMIGGGMNQNSRTKIPIYDDIFKFGQSLDPLFDDPKGGGPGDIIYGYVISNDDIFAEQQTKPIINIRKKISNSGLKTQDEIVNGEFDYGFQFDKKMHLSLFMFVYSVIMRIQGRGDAYIQFHVEYN